MATAANPVAPKPPLGSAYLTPEGSRVWPLLNQWGYHEGARKMMPWNTPGVSMDHQISLFGAKLRTPKRIPVEMAVKANQHLYTLPRMGSDPEFFIRRRGENFRIPAFMTLPGPKEPKPFGWFWDGFQAETTIKPEKCHVLMAQGMQHQFAKLWQAGYDLDLSSVWRVPEPVLMTTETKHVEFGCAPSKNIYGTQGAYIHDPRDLKWRFAGGHLHFELGASEMDAVKVKEMVKSLDAIVAVPFVAILAGYDHPIRRKYYGMAGEYRLPSHGLEYRSLSNGWLQHPQLFQLATDLARFAVNIGRMGLRKVFQGEERHIQQIINYCDVRGARELFRVNQELYRHFCATTYTRHSFPMERAVNLGVRAVLPDWDKGAMENWLSDHFRIYHDSVEMEKTRLWETLR